MSDPAVTTAVVDSTGTLVVTPLGRGAATVSLQASDGVLQVGGSFLFTVTEVDKLRRFEVAVPREQAISITNTSDRDVAFELRHNGHRLATTGDQLVQEVRDLPDDVPGEPFERKLWRYVRDGSYHFDPLTASSWQHDPLLFLNSVGFGYCDDVAAVYATLARAAGSRCARLGSCRDMSCPRSQIGGRWVAYDPDLAVYYHRGDGAVAGVEDLGQDPSLVTSPISRVSAWDWPFSSTVAAIFASTSDNRIIGPSFFVSPRNVADNHLPPGARLTYPGRWAALPSTLYETTLSTTAQLKLDVPAGFAGVVDWPLVPWDVQGAGRLRVNGVEYQAGSSELTAALQDLRPARAPSTGIEILEATSPVSIVYLLNPVRFSLATSTVVSLRSLDAWALDLSLVPLANGDRVGHDSLDSVARPR